MKNYYDELEVSKYASSDVINRAYKVLAKKYHPDTTTIDKQTAEERFKKISEAYETLSDAQKRAEYDKTLPADVDTDKYNKMLQDNRKLFAELQRLKSELNTVRSVQNTNINYDGYNQNINNNSNYYTYEVPKYKRKIYSFFDEIKFKLNESFKKFISITLTALIIFITLCILYAIPSTRYFIINDLHLGILFRFFK